MEDYKLTLVLMAGLPGAGKTTLARRLGYELQWQVIDKDSYKEELLQQGSDDDSAARAAYERSFHELHTALVQQRVSVIFDTAALHRFILDAAMQIVRGAANAQLKVILCVADRDLRNQRLRTRPYQSTRIRVDPATIADYFSHFRHLPSDKLVLYTISQFEECLAQAKAYVIPLNGTQLSSKLAPSGTDSLPGNHIFL